jgi:hypothetical protein
MATNKHKDIEERGDSEASIIADGDGLGDDSDVYRHEGMNEWMDGQDK